MPNPENLVRNEDRTPEKRKENARKAGIASGKARQRRKDLREILLEELYSTDKASGLTKAELITARCIDMLNDNPSMKDLRIVYELLGELTQNVSIDATGTDRPVIVFKGSKGSTEDAEKEE